MNQFPIQPIQQFASGTGPGAAIKRPRVILAIEHDIDDGLILQQEIAYFSYDDDHQFHLDERSLRYYYTPTLGADLSKGFDTFQQLDDTADDHLDSLLRTIIDLEGRTDTKCSADIITWRGMMTKVYSGLSAPKVKMLTKRRSWPPHTTT